MTVIVSPGRKIAAITITNSGTALLITDASDESIDGLLGERDQR